MNRASTPAQPETMRMPSRAVEADLADSSGQDEPSTVQSEDAIFQMLSSETTRRTHHILTEQSVRVGLSDWNWGRVNFDDISFRLEDEPASVQSQDAIFSMSPPRISSCVLTTGLADNSDIPLRLEGEPASVQSQHANFRSDRRVLTLEELNSFMDSSGAIEINDVLESQGFEPIEPASVQSQHANFWSDQRVLTLEELNSFRDSSGQIEIMDVLEWLDHQPLLSGDPILSNQSNGLSGRTISKHLKRMSANKIRAPEIDGDRKICAVCRDDVCGQKGKVAILDECGHEFHYRCLKKWLRRKNICPLCRRTAIYITSGKNNMLQGLLKNRTTQE